MQCFFWELQFSVHYTEILSLSACLWNVTYWFTWRKSFWDYENIWNDKTHELEATSLSSPFGPFGKNHFGKYRFLRSETHKKAKASLFSSSEGELVAKSPCSVRIVSASMIYSLDSVWWVIRSMRFMFPHAAHVTCWAQRCWKLFSSIMDVTLKAALSCHIILYYIGSG